ncbi:hypothetical protein OAQ84_01600, partial [Bdellovibrionales bacterium]|nr:hypothetical protein [Bdellovibrionales bacterium]
EVESKKLSDNVYKLLRVKDYNPEDLVLQFLPGAEVLCKPKKFSDGDVLPHAIQLANPKDDLVKYMGKAMIYVKIVGAKWKFRPTPAVMVEEMVFKILPSKNYDPEKEKWEFQPGSIAECQYVHIKENMQRLSPVKLCAKKTWLSR